MADEGDIGAPPFYFQVGMAAQQGARLLPLLGTVATPLLLETLQNEHEWGRAQAVQEVRKQLALLPELDPN